MVQTVMTSIQMVLGVLLIIAVLLQQKGAGLGAAFGGGSSSMHSTRRGSDLFLYRASIGLSLCFFGISLAIVILS